MKREDELLEATAAGLRLSRENALYLLEKGSWTSMAAAAHRIRCKKHNPKIVSYTAFRLVNYTNVCDIGCSFCSFQDELSSKNSYVLNLDEMRTKAEEARNQGADQIFLQGGVHSNLPLDYYISALQLFSQELGLSVRAFSPVELYRLAQKESMELSELLHLLKDAGLDSVPGAGAEILTEKMRQKLSPKKLSAKEWCKVMESCHEADLPGSANIVFGSDESLEDIVEHLEIIRRQQDRSGGFLTFVPWVFQPQTKRFAIRHIKSVEYLKLLALCRLFFDNIDNIEVSILVMGRELGEVGLYAGANDINSIVLEENVLRSHGLKSLSAAERFIREAGFEPKRRSLNFDFAPYAGTPESSNQ